MNVITLILQWQGRLKLPDPHGLESTDPRLAQLLAKMNAASRSHRFLR